MSREAMQLALGALESDPISHAGLVSRKQAVAALRQALETEQKTAVSPGKGTGFNYFRALGITSLRQALETEPEALRLAEWVGLADEQVEDEWERITGHSIFGGDRSEGRAMYISPNEVIAFSRAIEAKLREKNT